MAFFSSFLTQRKPRQFSYRPRFYDEKQEKRTQRIKMPEGETFQPNIRATFVQRRMATDRNLRKSRSRILIFAGIAASLVYLVFFK